MRSTVEWGDLEDTLERAAVAFGPAALMSLMKAGMHPLVQEMAWDTVDEQVDPGNNRWVPLKESTRRIRSRIPGISPDRPINYRTGRLQDYLLKAPASFVGIQDGYQMTFPGDVRMDSSRLMYSYHTAQAGSSRWGTPPRPVVGIGETAIYQLGAITVAYLNEVMGTRWINAGIRSYWT